MGKGGPGLGGELASLQLRSGTAASVTAPPPRNFRGWRLVCALDAPSPGSRVFPGVETPAAEEGSGRRMLPLWVQFQGQSLLGHLVVP